MRHEAPLILLALTACFVGCDRSATLMFDKQGQAHGTGEKVYHYEAGEVMLREQYINGRLEHSRWYAPDGTLIEETDWVDQAGEGIYLRQDGTIRLRMNYVDAIAEGPATYYDQQGNVTKIVEFLDGRPVEK